MLQLTCVARFYEICLLRINIAASITPRVNRQKSAVIDNKASKKVSC